ncbi:uncharacterized protein LOC126566028 [Anopheles maculipalpis]|uniref:uncharacterized protein LOC126566028 n=1 Tax=Anopheles maculipalpis TaxID=1496333 RepID=UPI002158F45E|nr:uncharacterized protein LOC126566028 [Anopheles maculipalpis]
MTATDRLGFTLTVVLAVLAASSVSALRCYTCNSYDNSECFAPPKNFTEEDLRDNSTVPARLLVECPPDEMGREPFCRKVNLLVIGGSVPDHTRVTRECGYDRARRPCYKVENGGHEEQVCQCFTDGCNEGSQITVSRVLGMVMCLTGLVLGFKHRIA